MPDLAGAGPIAASSPARATADRRVLLVLCLAMFMAVVNFQVLSPFLPAVARDLKTSVALLGQVTTTLMILSALLGMVIGPIADRFGHRRLMVGGFLAIAVNLFATSVVPSFPALLGLSLISGAGDAVLFGLPLAIAGSNFTGVARRWAIGWTAASLPLGMVIGVPVVTAAGSLIGWRGVVAALGVVTLGAAALARLWLPRQSSPAPRPARRWSFLSDYRTLLDDRGLRPLYAMSGLRGVCWIGVVTYLGAFLADDRGFSPSGIAVAYMVVGAGEMAGSLATRHLRFVSPRILIAIATALQAALVAGIFVLPLDPALTLSGLAPLMFCEAVSFVAVATLLTAETPGSAATTMILNGSVINLGSAFGSAIGGVLLAIGGYAALGLGLTLFGVTASVVALLSARRHTASHSLAP